MRLSRHERSGPSGGAGQVTPEDVEYELARLPRDVTTAITWYMKEHQLTKSELARRLGVTPGRVSQILSGDENLTLRTLATVCAALDAHLTVDLVPNAGGGAAARQAGPDFGVSHVAS